MTARTISSWWDYDARRGDRLEVAYLVTAGPDPSVGQVARVLDLRPGVEVLGVDPIAAGVYRARLLLLEDGRLGPRLGRYVVEGDTTLAVVDPGGVLLVGHEVFTALAAAVDSWSEDFDEHVVGVGAATEAARDRVVEAARDRVRPYYLVGGVVLLALVYSLLK